MMNLSKGKMAFLSFLLFFASCSSETKKAQLEQSSPINVQTEKVEKGTIETSMTFTGEIESLNQADVYPPFAEKILSFSQKNGVEASEWSYLHKGEVFAHLDPKNVKVKLLQAEAQVEIAEAALQKAKLTIDSAKKDQSRMSNLFLKGAITEKQKETADFALENAKATLSELKAQLKQAKAREKEVRLLLEEVEIKAPISGVISKIYLSPGNLAFPQKPLATFVDMERLKILLSMPETSLSLMEKDISHIEIYTDSSPNQTFYPKLEKIYPTIDPLTKMGTVELRLQNLKDKSIDKEAYLLRPGMYVKVTFYFQKNRNVPIIPLTSLLFYQGEYYVYLCHDGIASLQQVKLGERDEKKIEVLEGLQGGEELIIQKQNLLTEGSKVNVL